MKRKIIASFNVLTMVFLCLGQTHASSVDAGTLRSEFTSGTEAITALATGEYLTPTSGQIYRLQNQYNGKCVIKYVSTLYADHFIYPALPRFVWKFQAAGGTGEFYLRCGSGGSMKSPNSAGTRVLLDVTSSTQTGDLYKWKIERVDISGGRKLPLYTVKNVATGLYLAQNVNPNSPDLRNGPSFPSVRTYTSGEPKLLWSIEPTVLNPINSLSVPQGGWDPDALNKCAVLNSGANLGASIPYTVTGAGQTITGTAYKWGQYWNNHHFYIINLNYDALKTPGTYTLSANGKTAPIRIVDQAYIRPYRLHGADRFSIADLFDDKYGYVGHWAHLGNWYTKGTASMQATKRQWFDEYDNNGNGKKWEVITPQVMITEAEANAVYSGGWDMTDIHTHAFAADGIVLHELVLFYEASSDPTLKGEIAEEIVYGVNGLLNNQEPNGSWRQRAYDWSHWAGTVATLGGGLAAAQPIVEQYNPALGAQALIGANKAWNYVYGKRNTPGAWAVRNEGRLYDGTLLTGWPQTHRHGYASEYLEQAVDMYLLTGNTQAKAVVDDIIARGEINPYGRLRSTSGAKFPGEQGNPNRLSTRTPIALLKYYPSASNTQRQKILVMCRRYYNFAILRDADFDGPTGMFGGLIKGFYTGGQWQMPARMMLSAMMYDRFGDEFARGVIVAQRAFDYWTGCNPYATSLLLGIGDLFLVDGWNSYLALGRHVGLLSPTAGSLELQASKGTFMGKETTPGGSVAFWRSMLLYDKHVSSIDRVELYANNGYGGTKTSLCAGNYKLKHLKAYGMPANAISSVKVPYGFKAILYANDNFGGTATEITSDTVNLGGANNTCDSIKIVALRPSASIISPIDGTITVQGTPLEFIGVGADAQQGILANSALSWESDLDGQFGTGSSLLSSSLSAGTHQITLKATDNGSLIGTTTITLTVTASNTPEITVKGNGTNILDGDSTPSQLENTAFGNVVISNTASRIYTIQNVGTQPLTIQPVSVTGTGFSVISQPGSSVASGGSTTFAIRFAPQAVGTINGTVSFGTNDGDENPFNFSISGKGIQGGPFDPTSISGCELWVDANDIDGDGTAEGTSEAGIEANGSLGTWVDKSSQNNNAIQNVAAARAKFVDDVQHGKPIVRFDGINDYFSFTSITNIRTVFWVVKENTDASDERPLLGHSSEYEFHRGVTLNGPIWNSLYTHVDIRNGTTRLNSTHVNGVTTDLPEATFNLISLVTDGNVQANQLTQDRLYADRGWSGDIAEIIIYNTPLLAGDRESVEDYLTAKWLTAPPPPPDADNDGMLDDWETHYFGGTNQTGGAADGDWDGDGFPNLSEYIAGTNPTNPASLFELMILNTNGQIFVKYPAHAATGTLYQNKERYYDLYSTLNLTNTWNSVAGQTNVLGIGAVHSHTNQDLEPKKFFRVRTRLENF